MDTVLPGYGTGVHHVLKKSDRFGIGIGDGGCAGALRLFDGIGWKKFVIPDFMGFSLDIS
jgi:hypothetical protein